MVGTIDRTFFEGSWEGSRDVLSASIHMKVKKKLFVLQREMQNTMTTAQW